MVTARQRTSIEDLIMSIIAGAQVSIGAAQQAIEEAGGARAAISEAKKRVLESSIIQGPKKTIGFLSKMTKAIGGTFGIQFSIASILKQSQIFTGTLGTIFQILGAMVDVMLAPFMPIFVRVIRRMVSWIPLIQEKAEAAAEWLENAWFNNKGDTMNFLAAVIKKGISEVPWGAILKAIITNRPLTIAAGVALAPATGGASLAVAAAAIGANPQTQEDVFNMFPQDRAVNISRRDSYWTAFSHTNENLGMLGWE